jgi:hypothetical protein
LNQATVQVVSPFNLLPRSLLVATCNGVVRTVMNTMLNIFVAKLTQDYQLWSSDAAYRAERAVPTIGGRSDEL